MSEPVQENASPEEIARFDKLAARWWGESGAFAGCQWHPAPVSDRPGMAGPDGPTMDGSVPVGSCAHV